MTENNAYPFFSYQISVQALRLLPLKSLEPLLPWILCE